MTAARRVDLLFVGAVVVAAAVLLWSTSGFVFYLDEWRFLAFADDVSFASLMEPYNQHWFVLLKLIWIGLLETVGMRSYVPYHLVLIAFHIAVATALYVYARRQTHALPALALGVLFLFLGSGHTNLYWAASLGFVLASAFGAWALVILLRDPEPARPWLAAGLLVLAVASSGGGLFFLAAAVTIGAVRDIRRWWWVGVPAAIAFGVWFLAFGRSQSRDVPDPVLLFEYVRDGIGNAIAALSGANAVGQLAQQRELVWTIVFVLVVGTAVLAVVRRSRPNAGIIGAAVGLLALWVIVGLSRSVLHPDGFSAPRFIYEAAVLVLVAFIAWLGRRQLGTLRHPTPLFVLVGGLAAVAVAWNVLNLGIRGQDWYERGQEHRAAITVTLEQGGAAFPSDQGWGYRPPTIRLFPIEPGPQLWVPGRTGLEALLERHGSPLDDPLAFRGTGVPPAMLERVLEEATRGP